MFSKCFLFFLFFNHSGFIDSYRESNTSKNYFILSEGAIFSQFDTESITYDSYREIKYPSFEYPK